MPSTAAIPRNAGNALRYSAGKTRVSSTTGAIGEKPASPPLFQDVIYADTFIPPICCNTGLTHQTVCHCLEVDLRWWLIRYEVLNKQ